MLLGTKIQKRSENTKVFTFFHYKIKKVQPGHMQLPRTHLLKSCGFILLLRSLTVAAHELINTSCGVNELALTCVEWVRGA